VDDPIIINDCLHLSKPDLQNYNSYSEKWRKTD